MPHLSPVYLSLQSIRGFGAREVFPDGAQGRLSTELLLTLERGERGGAAAAPAGAQASAGSASRAELGEGENSDRNIIGN